LQKKKINVDDYKPEDYLSIRDVSILEIYNRHCIYVSYEGQGGDEWCYMSAFTDTSTLCHAILPHTNYGLSDQVIELLKNDLGLSVRSVVDIDVDIYYGNIRMCWILRNYSMNN
jgi:hypothetical protein